MKKIIILSFLILIVSCSSAPVKSNYIASTDILENVNSPVSEADALRIKIAKDTLKQCEQLRIDYDELVIAYNKLKDNYNGIAEKAGAGDMIYTIIYFIAFLIGAFIVYKILKKFSIF